MSRMVGTVSMGIRAPIIRSGDDLVEIVTNSVLETVKDGALTIRDRDVIAMTEAIVARAQGNYASVDDIAADVRAKLGRLSGEALRPQPAAHPHGAGSGLRHREPDPCPGGAGL